MGGGQREDRHVTQDNVWWSGIGCVEVQGFSSPHRWSSDERDVNPEQKVHEYDYSKLYSGNGTKFHTELQMLREMISRLPPEVKQRNDCVLD
jgi:hypothetical protein